MQIKIIDLNKELIDLAQSQGYEAIHSDYFREVYNTEKPVMITASNPMWTFGGGIDAEFKKHFPKLCELKQYKGGGMERISNIIFAITVDEHLKATKEQVKKALEFAKTKVGKEETLCLTGLGTAIGGLDIKEFLEVLKNNLFF